jgi:hypothetical protein
MKPTFMPLTSESSGRKLFFESSPYLLPFAPSLPTLESF